MSADSGRMPIAGAGEILPDIALVRQPGKLALRGPRARTDLANAGHRPGGSENHQRSVFEVASGAWNMLELDPANRGSDVTNTTAWQPALTGLFQRYFEISTTQRLQLEPRLGSELMQRTTALCQYAAAHLSDGGIGEDKANRWLGFVQGCSLPAGR